MVLMSAWNCTTELVSGFDAALLTQRALRINRVRGQYY
jgi:hypothetical protein